MFSISQLFSNSYFWFIMILVFIGHIIINTKLKKQKTLNALYGYIKPLDKRDNMLELVGYPLELTFAGICLIFLGVFFELANTKINLKKSKRTKTQTQGAKAHA